MAAWDCDAVPSRWQIVPISNGDKRSRVELRISARRVYTCIVNPTIGA